MATPTPTATERSALTTPFEQQSGCESNFAQTSILSTKNRSTFTVPVLLSTAKPSCYPSGWEDTIPESRFQFYPAVCPSGWGYYAMAAHGDISSAYCCNAGYTEINFGSFDLVREGIFRGALCGRWMQNTDDTPDNTQASESLALHHAWTVSWNKTDTSTLTPQLPTLTSGMEIPTWTPGEEIPDGKYDPKPVDDGPIGTKFLTIGVPVIVVTTFLIIVFVGFRCYKSKQRRRARARQ